MKPEAPITFSSKLGRIARAASYSWRGFRSVYRAEAAFRDEVLLTCVSIPLAAWLSPNLQALLYIIAAHLVVFSTELLNSGLEALVDLVSPHHHELAGRAKDAGSAAVLCALGLLALAWGNLLIALIGV